MAARHPLRILLAEDNVVNQKLAMRILQQMGYRADLASNGIEAVESVERQPYDVVLMDVQMPEMDGLEASRRIAQRWPAGERPRIVAMTANAMQGDRELCLQAGMDDYLTKPIRVDQLVAALDAVQARKDRWPVARRRVPRRAFGAVEPQPSARVGTDGLAARELAVGQHAQAIDVATTALQGSAPTKTLIRLALLDVRAESLAAQGETARARSDADEMIAIAAAPRLAGVRGAGPQLPLARAVGCREKRQAAFAAADRAAKAARRSRRKR